METAAFIAISFMKSCVELAAAIDLFLQCFPCRKRIALRSRLFYTIFIPLDIGLKNAWKQSLLLMQLDQKKLTAENVAGMLARTRFIFSIH